MGCSPSRSDSLRGGRTLQPGPVESTAESPSDSASPGDTDGEGGQEGRGPSAPSEDPQGGRPPSPGAVSSEAVCPERAGEDGQGRKGARRPRKGRAARPGKKEKGAAPGERKVDFPEPLVRAHRAAYAYLNPSVSRYEALLALLEQAAQTQQALQPMACFLALRYEELNRALEDMARGGERLLEESGEQLAWPPGAPEPPDLLQQLLQYTLQRLRALGGTAGALGDAALQDAADYFGSLAELLEEKLQAKRALEGRLGRVLARLEAAALRRPGPQDSALQSEDSGLGADSESLAGPRPPGGPRPARVGSSLSLSSLDSSCPPAPAAAELGSEGHEEEEEEEEEGEQGGEGGPRRPPPPPAGPSQEAPRPAPKRMENPENEEMTLRVKDAMSGRIRFVPAPQRRGPGGGAPAWPEEGERPARRPQTAAAAGGRRGAGRQRRSRSAESLRGQAEDPTLLQLQRTQKELSRRLDRMRGAPPSRDTSRKREEPPTSSPSPPAAPQPPASQRGRTSVQRLIDTFSQGAPKSLAPLRGVRRCGVPILPAAPRRPEELDLDSLPPPPPEVLMDTSFQGSLAPPGGEGEAGAHTPTRGRCPAPQKAGLSQRLRASLSSVPVLPNRAGPRREALSLSPARPGRKVGPRSGSQDSQDSQDPQDPQPKAGPEDQEAASLYRTARKIIHLRHNADSPPAAGQEKRGGASPPAPAPAPAHRPPCGPQAPGRARLLPSTPANPSNPPTLHRRLPSPPVFRSQPAPPSPAGPPAPQIPPSPPQGPRRLPSPPQWKQAASTPTSRRDVAPSSACLSAGLAKAPSPPASPRTSYRRTPGGSNGGLAPSSPVLSNARSVFCPASPSLFEAQPAPAPQAWPPPGACVLPRPWGGRPSRGRLPLGATHSPQPFVKRSHSDRRPSLTLQPRPLLSPSGSVSSGSEPAISTQGLEEGPACAREPWDSQHQSELRTSRSASHPELCIVGQALQ